MKTNGENLIAAGNLILQRLADYLDRDLEGSGKVLELQTMSEISKDLRFHDLIKQGGMNLQQLDQFLSSYLKHSVHMHHPAYIGHQVAPPHLGSALGELIHGVISNPMSIYEMGQSAATIESEMVSWMLDKIGWSDTGAGVFTHGGSVSNIHALLAARSHIAPQSWLEGTPDDLVVLAPDSSHYSITRAVSIIGLGSKAIISLPTDQYERIIPGMLAKTIAEVRARGQRVMAIVANACATSTGIYDPIREMAECCREHHCWLHVDSPHAVLFRNRNAFEQTFSQKASYLLHPKDNPGVDTLPFQIECTKSALATKLFLVLACLGEEGMSKYITHLYDQARAFAALIDQRPGFTVNIPVESNIICFQYRPEHFDQLKLRERMVARGDYYITSTEVKGSRYLRLVVMNEHTDATIINGLLDQIELQAKSL